MARSFALEDATPIYTQSTTRKSERTHNLIFGVTSNWLLLILSGGPVRNQAVTTQRLKPTQEGLFLKMDHLVPNKCFPSLVTHYFPSFRRWSLLSKYMVCIYAIRRNVKRARISLYINSSRRTESHQHIALPPRRTSEEEEDTGGHGSNEDDQHEDHLLGRPRRHGHPPHLL